MVIQPKPAVTQVRLVRPDDEAPRRGEHVAEMQLDAPPLVRLAGGQRNAIEMFIDAHQRKAQVRLARIALGIAVDEAAARPSSSAASRRRHR